MAFRAAICESCNRDIQVPTDVRTPACPYCGETISERAAPAATLSTLLGLAHTAMAAGNSVEATEYYNRVLESDPRNSQAWLGKGKAAGWQSSLANIRLPEMLMAFNHSIANSIDDEKAAIAQEASIEVNRLVVALYGMGRKHMLEYVALPNIWPAYVQQVAQMVDALSTVINWLPNDRITLDNLVQLCKDNIEGVKYRDTFDNNIAKAWALAPAYEQTLRGILNSSIEKLKVIDPAYEAPSIEKKTADACFIVTATMGDFDHPTVTFMRHFRDTWLLNRPWGKRFVDWYYIEGPSAANFIARSKARRKLAYVLVVLPSAGLARMLLGTR